MYDKDFELDEFYFDSEQKYMGVQPVRKYYASLYGNANWVIDNDSFDYAGTHCTHGQSGTCHLPDYAVVQDCSLDQINIYFEVYDRELGAWFEAEKKFFWRYEKDRSFIKRFEIKYDVEIMQMLQDQEDKHESVIESIKQYAEEMRYGL